MDIKECLNLKLQKVDCTHQGGKSELYFDNYVEGL